MDLTVECSCGCGLEQQACLSGEQQRRMQAPSVSECLDDQGIPRHLHADAESAFRHWLHTWQNCGETAESLCRRLTRGY